MYPLLQIEIPVQCTHVSFIASCTPWPTPYFTWRMLADDDLSAHHL